MQQTQTILNDILSSIIDIHNKGGDVSPFEVASLKRDILKLPTVNEQQHSLGMLFAAQKKRDEMKQAFENALSSSMSDETDVWNYWVSMKLVGLTPACLKRAKELTLSRKHLKLGAELVSWYTKLFQLDDAAELLDFCRSFNDENYAEEINSAEMELNMLDKFFTEGSLPKEELNSIGNAVLSLIETKGIKVSFGVSEHLKERNHISVTYGIDEERYTSSQVCDLNFDIADALIDKDLDRLPVVVKFVRLPTEMCKSEVGLI